MTSSYRNFRREKFEEPCKSLVVENFQIGWYRTDTSGQDGQAPLCCPPNFDALLASEYRHHRHHPPPSKRILGRAENFSVSHSLSFPLPCLQSRSCVILEQSSPPRYAFPRHHLIPNPAETLIAPSG